MKTILIATEKPFASAAVNQMKSIAEGKGYKVELLEKYTDKQDLINAVANVDAMIIRSDKATKEVLDAAKNLKVIVRAGAGFDNIDLDAATANGMVAMNTPGQNSNAVAELVMSMMVFMARNQFNGTAGKEVKGKKLGIHAYGNVGKNVARIAKGFGMEVYAHDPFVDANAIEADGVKVIEKQEDLYKTCQYISLHIPATPKTVKSINYDLLNLMPEGATLLNTARKEVIDEEGVIKLMKDRADFCHISDVAPDNKNAYAEFEGRYFFTPKKMGAQTAEANINAGIAAVNQIINFFENGDETFRVNK